MTMECRCFYLVPITMLLLFLTTLSIISMVKGLVCDRFATGAGYSGLIRNLLIMDC